MLNYGPSEYLHLNIAELKHSKQKTSSKYYIHDIDTT